MEQLRFHRLLEFEKKRAVQEQQRDREQLALEAAAIALAEIEKQRALLSYRRHRSRSQTRSIEQTLDDYESSTATSISSRAGDFDGIEAVLNEPMEIIEASPEPPDTVDVVNATEPSLTNGSPTTDCNQQSIIEEAVAPPSLLSNEPTPKQSLFKRLLFGTAKQSSESTQRTRTYLNIPVDDGQPISYKRIVCVESPLVWHQVIELHPIEWQRILLLRNRCIANFIILCMLFGLGGFIFRFIEGTFEHFYKCGVRRVKRDFVDHLWATSRELRFDSIQFSFGASLSSVHLPSFTISD